MTATERALTDLETLRQSLPSVVVGPNTAELWAAFYRIRATLAETGLREVAQAFVDRHLEQAEWKEDYSFPSDEFNALRAALEKR